MNESHSPSTAKRVATATDENEISLSSSSFSSLLPSPWSWFALPIDVFIIIITILFIYLFSGFSRLLNSLISYAAFDKSTNLIRLPSSEFVTRWSPYNHQKNLGKYRGLSFLSRYHYCRRMTGPLLIIAAIQITCLKFRTHPRISDTYLNQITEPLLPLSSTPTRKQSIIEWIAWNTANKSDGEGRGRKGEGK